MIVAILMAIDAEYPSCLFKTEAWINNRIIRRYSVVFFLARTCFFPINCQIYFLIINSSIIQTLSQRVNVSNIIVVSCCMKNFCFIRRIARRSGAKNVRNGWNSKKNHSISTDLERSNPTNGTKVKPILISLL